MKNWEEKFEAMFMADYPTKADLKNFIHDLVSSAEDMGYGQGRRDGEARQNIIT